MRFVQTTIWIAITLIAIVLEMLVRVTVFFPLGIIVTIIGTLLGAKYWLSDNTFLMYCSPWIVGDRGLVVSKAVSMWLDPHF